MDRIEELKKIVAAGYAARDELADLENADATLRNSQMIGKCQKFSNSYGSGDRWWLYRRILSVDGNQCACFRFQTTSSGLMEIQARECEYIGGVNEWHDIDESEFNAAWDSMKAALRRASGETDVQK